MALFRWIADKLFGPPKRDVSRLEEDDVDAIDESVDLSGGPLKPGHRRRALRDRRLLPKRRASGLSPLRRKKKRLLEVEEAARLFSATQLTRDRGIRDLAPDEQQLSRLGLPLWLTERDVAAALGVSLKELYHFSIHRHRSKVSHYVTFAIPKRTGGERLIMAPKTRLKALQRSLLTLLLEKLPVPPQAHAFCKGRSIKTGAAAHVGKAVVVKMDLENFFPSVTFPRVRGLFISLGYSYPVATTLAVLCTECERQPVLVEDQLYQVPVGRRHCVQGAPTSPAICNQIAARLDHRLAGLARKLGFSYTRYADDLVFSGDDASKVKSLLGLARRIVGDEGFRVNPKKTAIRRQASRQTVTGVVVNQTLGLSRQERRKMRAQIHRLSQQSTVDPGEQRVLMGRLAYLHMLNPEQAASLRRQLPGGAGS
jgi:RNA-directed DNA polymerase